MKIRVGRPTLYRGDIHPAFAAHLAQEGKTEDEIAERLGVNRSTLVEWKNKYPEFSNAMKSNKEEADSVVEQSLYRKAVQGDVIACRYWLSNRQPAKWREKQEVEQSGTVKVEGKIEVLSLEDVTKKYADAGSSPVSSADSPSQ